MSARTKIYSIFALFVLFFGFPKQSFTLNKIPKSQGYLLYRRIARTPDLRESTLKMIAVYKITNLITNDCYVGRTVDLDRRIMEHFSPKKAKDRKAKIYAAIADYGKHNFKVDVLEEVSETDILDEREMFWIDQLKPSYNQNKGGRGNVGYKPTDTTRERLKQSGKIQWQNKTEEEKRKIIKENLTGPTINHSVSEETKQKLRLANVGKKQSAETIAKRASKIKVAMIGNKSGNKRIVSKLNGHIVKEYESVKQAAGDFGAKPERISAVLTGRRKTFRGLNWEYANKQIK